MTSDNLFDDHQPTRKRHMPDPFQPEPETYKERAAVDLADAKTAHYSADAIMHRMHRIRWHYEIDYYELGRFKINDHYASRYARKLMKERPKFDGFFELRVLNSEGESEASS